MANNGQDLRSRNQNLDLNNSSSKLNVDIDEESINGSVHLDHQEESLDVFISHRRSSGRHLARLLKAGLQSKEYKVFLDVESLEGGKFDINILLNIKKAKSFLLVLTPKALDRCIGDYKCEDWVHKEIVTALESKRRIIPVTDDGFEWPAWEELPTDMRDILRYNALSWSHQYSDAVIEKIDSFIKEPSSKEIPKQRKNNKILKKNRSNPIPFLFCIFWGISVGQQLMANKKDDKDDDAKEK